jgi:isoquinoline 1-oxidoreductase beta subunit
LAAHHDPSDNSDAQSSGLDRRRFLGFLIAAPTLAVGVQFIPGLAGRQAADASIITPPEPEEIFDLGDAQDLAAAPTAGLITVVVNPDGTASFAAIRTEVGQGMTTAIAMIIAEYLDIEVHQVSITLADARPELLLNQLTGGSNSMRSQYTPTANAAQLAKQQLVAAAARKWNVSPSALRTASGTVIHPDGRKAGYGELATLAAVTKTRRVALPEFKAKDRAEFRILGHPTPRIDAYDIVTGQKTFCTDIQVPGALPTMVARPPTINGTVVSVNNTEAILAMPGITDVVPISTGVAIRGQTHGQCIDAIQKIKVTWGPGTVDSYSDSTVLSALVAAEPPFLVPPVGDLTTEGAFTFYFASNTPLEPDNAIAVVTPTSAEIWSCLKVPIDALQDIAIQLDLPQDAVTVHVAEGGGSFGRHLFHDAATEAVEAAQKIGKPVHLMWSRTDTFRQGRTHPMAISRVQATTLLGNVVTYQQYHTDVQTSFSHGLGEILTATAASLPIVGNFTFAETIFLLSQSSPYNFGVTTQLLNEIPLEFNTGSMRNIYSPNAVTAEELIVDQLAAQFGQDPVAFRQAFLKDSRVLAVLNKAAEVGNWGKTMPAHCAQGIAVHSEYQAAVAVLVEINCTPQVVNRKVHNGYTGPRVTKVLVVADPGFCINPLGFEAQMIGGVEDGIGLALTASMHLQNGLFLEGSWDNFFYTREWNTPPDIQVIITNTSSSPSGAGELAVAPTFAAVACAYARATGTMPTSFPINHGTLGFTPYPAEPSTPQSPTDGLKYTF